MAAKTLELSVAAAPESVGRVRRQVAEVARAAGWPGRLVDDMRLCVTEAIANAVAHAYGAPGGMVDLEVEVEDDELRVTVRDQGRGLAVRRDEPERGYGLQLMRALSAECSITSDPYVGTEVRMRFRR